MKFLSKYGFFIAGFVACALCVVGLRLAQAGGSLIRVTATQSGVNGANLADTPEATFTLEQGRTTNQLSMIVTIVKGTSAQLRVKCRGTSDDTNFGFITSCKSTTPHVCAVREYNFDDDVVAGETNWTIDVPTNYTTVKCTFDDPADGTGTVTVRAVKGF